MDNVPFVTSHFRVTRLDRDSQTGGLALLLPPLANVAIPPDLAVGPPDRHIFSVAWQKPDNLSDWTLPPLDAREGGETGPVRVFDTAEAALAFLAASVRLREPRRLPVRARAA